MAETPEVSASHMVCLHDLQIFTLASFWSAACRVDFRACRLVQLFSLGQELLSILLVAFSCVLTFAGILRQLLAAGGLLHLLMMRRRA